MRSLRKLRRESEHRRATRITDLERINIGLYRRNPVLFVEKELGETPSEDQAKLLMDAADLDNLFFIICAGRGSGKTKVVSWIIDWNEAVLVDYFPKYDTYDMGGSFEQSKRMYDYFRNDIYKTPLLYKRLKDDPTMRETRFRSGKVQALAASSRQVRGPHVECLILDEVCEADDDIVMDSLSMIIGGQHGRIIMLSTPHKFYGIFQDYWEDAEKYGYVKYGPWSLWDCPWVKKDYLDILKRTFTPDRYTYDVLGKFPEFGKLLFSKKWISKCTAAEPFTLNRNFDCDLGIDWGDTEAKTAMVPVQFYDSKIRIPGPEHIWEDVPSPEIIEDVARFQKLHRGKTAYCDSSQRGNNDFLEKARVDVERIYFGKDKGKMQVNLQSLLYHGEIEISPDCVQLLEELRKYRRPAKGRAKPKGQDCVDGLMAGAFQFADEDLLRESSVADKFITM